MDKVIIKNLRVRAIIGVNDDERLTPQDILVNVTIFIDTRAATTSDNIQDCVDYSHVANEIRSKAISVKRFTVEALAEDLAKIILLNPKVLKVIVRIEKPAALQDAESAGIEIERPWLRN
jgi:FolB domain-containing protein